MSFAATTGRTATLTERDVRKGVTEIIALDTPVTSTIGKDPAPLETTPEWEIKTYANRSTAGWIEGATPADGDYVNNEAQHYMLKGRFIQQLIPVGVTKIQKLLGNSYNRKNPLADNVMDSTAVLYSNVEPMVLSDDEATAPVAATTASNGRSFLRWISNADGRFTDTATTPTSTWRTPAASIVVSKAAATDVTESEIAGLITNVATTRRKAGMRFMGLCTPLMRDQFDSFSRTDKSYTTSAFPVSRFNQKQGSIDREVTFYKSSNGTVELMTTFDLHSTCHFALLSPDLLRFAYAQGVQVASEGATSQVEKRVIDVIHVPKCLNPGGHGKIITGATA